MGLKETIAAGVSAAFDAMGNLPVSATITRTTPGAYSTTLGTTSEDTVTTYTVSGIKSGFKQDFIDGSVIQPGDCKFIFPASEIAIDPTPGDQVTIGGQYFSVVEASIDPAGAAWTLHLR